MNSLEKKRLAKMNRRVKALRDNTTRQFNILNSALIKLHDKCEAIGEEIGVRRENSPLIPHPRDYERLDTKINKILHILVGKIKGYPEWDSKESFNSDLETIKTDLKNISNSVSSLVPAGLPGQKGCVRTSGSKRPRPTNPPLRPSVLKH